MIISTASSLKVANKDELASIIDEHIHQYGETCWHVSNVEFMTAIFCKSPFNGDLSNWHSPNLKGTIYFNKPHWSILGIQSILYMMELNVKMGDRGYVWPSSMPIMPWPESLERIAKLSQELGTPRKDASYIIFNELTHHPVEHKEPIDFNLD